MRRSRLRVDSFVESHLRRISGLLAPEPDDPVERRRVARANDKTVAALLGTAPRPAWTQDAEVPVRGHPNVRVRVLRPSPPRSAARRDQRLPALVYAYGGAFTLGGIDWISVDALLRARALDAGIAVVAVDYLHAPEHRFPTQIEQVWSALDWTFSHANELGVDPRAVAIGGASSGGNLAAAATLLDRDRRDRRIALQVLENPALDMTMRHADMTGIGPAMPGVILRRTARVLVEQYLGPEWTTLARSPLASPLLSPDHTGLPPAWISTSELDPLRGDGEAYARALLTSGVPATAVRFIGQTHDSLGFGHLPVAAAAERAVIAQLRSLHEGTSDDTAPGR